MRKRHALRERLGAARKEHNGGGIGASLRLSKGVENLRRALGSKALGGETAEQDPDADPEDTINEALEKRMKARKMLANASNS